MIDKNKQKALDIANNLQEIKRIQLIREGVREKYPNPSDEIAILRKAVAVLFEVVAKLHPEIDSSEFAEYNAIVEQIKTEATEEVGL